MLDKVNDRVKNIEVPGIRVFSNQVTKYEDGINFTIGEPDFAPPERVKEAGINEAGPGNAAKNAARAGGSRPC